MRFLQDSERPVIMMRFLEDSERPVIMVRIIEDSEGASANNEKEHSKLDLAITSFSILSLR